MKIRVNAWAVQAARRLAGLSQVQLALAAEVSPSYIAMIEKGTRQHPDFAIVSRIARVCGVPVEVLLYDPTD